MTFKEMRLNYLNRTMEKMMQEIEWDFCENIIHYYNRYKMDRWMADVGSYRMKVWFNKNTRQVHCEVELMLDLDNWTQNVVCEELYLLPEDFTDLAFERYISMAQEYCLLSLRLHLCKEIQKVCGLDAPLEVAQANLDDLLRRIDFWRSNA